MDRKEKWRSDRIVVVEVTVVPIGTEGPSLSEYVAEAIQILEDGEVEYELTSMGTLIEGELEETLEVARKMHESVFSDKIERVVTNIRIDDRRDKELSIQGKKDSVEERMKKRD